MLFRVVLSSVLLFGSSTVLGQECPEQSKTGATVPSTVRTLQGRLVFHDDIRQGFELKLDQPQCGQKSIQLVSVKDDWTPIEVLRGCRVKSTGTIDYAGTGYFSLDVFQAVDEIQPLDSCSKQPPFPDYSKAKPDKSIRAYRVQMDINYRPGDHPVIFHVTSAGRELRPWQAYAGYYFTGGFVLYGQCAEGFSVGKVFGTPQAHPSKIDYATFDPEGAAAAGVKDLNLAYTCVREQ